MPRICYAAQSPRGFANETVVCHFETRAERDRWVDAHAEDGGVNAATCGAYAITAEQAQRILGDRGDAATETYHRLA